MYSKFPFPISMENIPRQRGLCCISLRVGCVITALVAILFSIFGLAQCAVALGLATPRASSEEDLSLMLLAAIISRTIDQAITFVTSAVLLIGTLKKSLQLIKPWIVWSSVHITVFIMLFVFFVAINSTYAVADASPVVYLITFLVLVIRTYMLILVSSFYRQVEEDKDEMERLKMLISKETWYGV